MSAERKFETGQRRLFNPFAPAVSAIRVIYYAAQLIRRKLTNFPPVYKRTKRSEELYEKVLRFILTAAGEGRFGFNGSLESAARLHPHKIFAAGDDTKI
jgi:hypothetical protein